MSEKPTVVVLGGHAFTRKGEPFTTAGQLEVAHQVARDLEPVLEQGRVVITHGNGPQVGHMLIRVEKAKEDAYALPLSVCVAATVGEIGYLLQQSLYNAAQAAGASRSVATLVTQVEVDRADTAFDHPDKPIGPVLSTERAAHLRASGVSVGNDRGRGLRRIVPSPRPVRVLGIDIVHRLLRDDVVVIAAGGGGIPVVRDEDGTLWSIDAVVDKDRTSALLADEIGARRLIVLTGVAAVCLDFDTPTERPLDSPTRAELRSALAQGAFGPGTMAPKIEAALAFTSKPGREVLICDSGSLGDALQGRAGTWIRSDSDDISV